MSVRRAAHARRQASVDYPRYPPANSQTQQPPLQQPQLPQVLQAPFVSDYESDNPGYTSDYPPKPPPPTRTTDELNLAVLQRHNPQISAILSIAPYAVLYQFSPLPEPAWSKVGIEGTMFICQLALGSYGEDRYNVIVLNRRGLNNFDAELRESEDGGVEYTDPYVIISSREDGEQCIYGVFIFSEGSGTSTEQVRVANAELMKTLAISAGTSRTAAEAAAMTRFQEQNRQDTFPAASNANAGKAVDLLALFGQPKGEPSPGGSTYQSGPAVSQQTPLSPHESAGVYPGQKDSHPQQQDVLGDLFRRAGLR